MFLLVCAKSFKGLKVGSSSGNRTLVFSLKYQTLKAASQHWYHEEENTKLFNDNNLKVAVRSQLLGPPTGAR